MQLELKFVVFCQQMAPMRSERGGSPARAARASLPLPRRLIRQIARHVASSGRSLRRLEVSGRVIDNFDDIEDGSDESDLEAPQPAWVYITYRHISNKCSYIYCSPRWQRGRGTNALLVSMESRKLIHWTNRSGAIAPYQCGPHPRMRRYWE